LGRGDVEYSVGTRSGKSGCVSGHRVKISRRSLPSKSNQTPVLLFFAEVAEVIKQRNYKHVSSCRQYDRIRCDKCAHPSWWWRRGYTPLFRSGLAHPTRHISDL